MMEESPGGSHTFMEGTWSSCGEWEGEKRNQGAGGYHFRETDRQGYRTPGSQSKAVCSDWRRPRETMRPCSAQGMSACNNRMEGSISVQYAVTRGSVPQVVWMYRTATGVETGKHSGNQEGHSHKASPLELVALDGPEACPPEFPLCCASITIQQARINRSAWLLQHGDKLVRKIGSSWCKFA